MSLRHWKVKRCIASDKIAYINHDIDDAVRSGILSYTDLPKDCIDVLGNSHSKRINTMITDVINAEQR